MVEKTISEFIDKYSDNYASNVDIANQKLIEDCEGLMYSFSYSELVYIFKQVLLRYYCMSSQSYVQAASRLKINRTTLAELRRRDNGEMYLYRPYGVVD